MARDYRKIRAWQLADALALDVYTATRNFPKSEVFGLTSQIRRSAVSVAANIVEGSARQHEREYVQFLYLACGSLAETGYHIDLAHRLGYLTDTNHAALVREHESATRTLRALINFIERGSRPAPSESNVHGPKSNVIERNPHA